jgi:pyroglutamyl-peptidase
MNKRLLLTSFDTWLPHQKSNSSDDLLIEVAKLEKIPLDLTFERQLPVNIEQASSRVIQKICQIQPLVVICCGMAESRTKLTVELNACSMSLLHNSSIDSLTENCKETVLQTKVDLKKLVKGGRKIEISYDCGKFVCEGLYYSVLDYIRQSQQELDCIFVHVPILTEENLQVIIDDFLLIIHQLAL